jgi:cellobiose-specific phosphotransferase system component IIC
MHVKKWLLMLISGTVSLVILITIASWAIRGPESVPPESRERMYALISLLVGMLSGYLLGKGNGGK